MKNLQKKNENNIKDFEIASGSPIKKLTKVKKNIIIVRKSV